jgi:hypothetical protein
MKVIDRFSKALGSRSDKIFLCCLSALLLILGYSVGYFVAETKRPTPIVFEGNDTRPQILSESDIEKLNSLAQAGTQNSPPAAVAGEQTENLPASVPQATTNAASFVASVSGAKYYFLTCAETKRIKEENKIFFKTEQEAIDAGYSASSCVLKSH